MKSIFDPKKETTNIIGILFYTYIFYVGFSLSIPVSSENTLPWYVDKIVINGIDFKDYIFIIMIIISIASRVRYKFDTVGICLIAMGMISFCLTTYNSIRSPEVAANEIIKSFRLLMFSILNTLIYNGKVNILKALEIYVSGSLLGAIINIFYSLMINELIVGIKLLGQNGPGINFLISYYMALLLWLRDIDGKLYSFIFVGVIFTSGIILSFSKTAQILNIMGNLCFIIGIQSSKKNKIKLISLAIIITVLLVLTLNDESTIIFEYLTSKVFGGGEKLIDADADKDRIDFFWCSFKSLIDSPIWGHGISSSHQQLHKYGCEVDDERWEASNPHNTILLYIISFGMLGLILLSVILIEISRSFLEYSKNKSINIKIIIIATLFAIFAILNVVPTGLTTVSLYLFYYYFKLEKKCAE